MNDKEAIDKFKEHIKCAIAIATERGWGEIKNELGELFSYYENDAWWERDLSLNDILDCIYEHVDNHE